MMVLSAGPALAAGSAGSTGEADSSTVTGTGLFSALDTGTCTATDTPTTTTGNRTGRCGDGLNLNNQIKAFSQNASAPGDGTSSANASAAPIDITNLGTSLDLNGILKGLGAINTGTILDQVIQGLSPALQTALNPLKQPVIQPLNDALQKALANVTSALPITLSIGAVNAQCHATASPKRATGTRTVAGISLNVNLGGQTIKVPTTLSTSPNSNLLVGSPRQLVDGIIKGLEASFTQSLGSALQPLNTVLSTLQQKVTDAIFKKLEAQLLPAVANALAPIVKGTVNEQRPISPSSTGEISVTALDLTVLGSNSLKLARTHCGPNGLRVAPTPSPSQPAQPAPKHHPAKLPLHIDSGLAGSSHGQGHGETVLAILASLFAITAASGTFAYRRFKMPRA